MKVKRFVVYKRYAGIIDEMYGAPNRCPQGGHPRPCT